MKDKFKLLLKRNNWFRHVPNTLTLCNSLCGFISVLVLLQVYGSPQDQIANVFTISAWVIIGAMVFDTLDGFAARIFNAASMHGVQMDSLADMVTFGMAPAVLVAIMAHVIHGEKLSLGGYMLTWGLAGVYMGCAALRLATYNVHAILKKKSSEKFSGLPTPGGAAAVCSAVIYFSGKMNEMEVLTYALPCYAAILGFLMVSNVPYAHLGRWVLSVRRNRKRLFLLLIIAICVILFRSLAIVVIVNIYIFWGLGAALAAFFRSKKKE